MVRRKERTRRHGKRMDGRCGVEKLTPIFSHTVHSGQMTTSATFLLFARTTPGQCSKGETSEEERENRGKRRVALSPGSQLCHILAQSYLGLDFCAQTGYDVNRTFLLSSSWNIVLLGDMAYKLIQIYIYLYFGY